MFALIIQVLKNNACQHLQAAKCFRQIWFFQSTRTHARTAHLILQYCQYSIYAKTLSGDERLQIRKFHYIIPWCINMAVFWKNLKLKVQCSCIQNYTMLWHKIDCKTYSKPPSPNMQHFITQMHVKLLIRCCSQTPNTHSNKSFMPSNWLFSLKWE